MLSNSKVFHTQLLCKSNHPTGEKSGQRVQLITLMVMLRLLIDSSLDHHRDQKVHKRNTHTLLKMMLSLLVNPSKPLRVSLEESQWLLQRTVDSIWSTPTTTPRSN